MDNELIIKVENEHASIQRKIRHETDWPQDWLVLKNYHEAMEELVAATEESKRINAELDKPDG